MFRPGSEFIASLPLRYLYSRRISSQNRMALNIIILLSIFFFINISFLFSLAFEASAQNCEKLLGKAQAQAWKTIPCEKLQESYMLPVRELPELYKIIGAPLEEATKILGLPFHIYSYEGKIICFFRPEAFLSIIYNENTEMPDIIKFNFIGAIRAEEIPGKIGIKNFIPPTIADNSLIWENIGQFDKLEVKYPDLRIGGEQVYEVSLYLPPAEAPPKKVENNDGNGRRRGGRR